MIAIAFNNFLGALAQFMGAAADLKFAVLPRQLWVNQAVETEGAAAGSDPNCGDPYSIFRQYDGDIEQIGVDTIRVQCETTASSNDAGMAQAGALRNTLLDANGRPLRMTAIPAFSGGPAYRINAARPRAPGLVRRDERGRGVVVFNVELEIVALAS